jgi:aldehyde dehydrogenase (NAD+)
MQEEIFGPLLPILGVADLDEAVRIVRSRPKPLAAYLFTSSRLNRQRLVADIPAGGIVVNHVMFHAVMPQLPFGGVGNSGMGAYHGRWGFETFSHRKAVLRKTQRPDISLVYPPYTGFKQKVLRRLF